MFIGVRAEQNMWMTRATNSRNIFSELLNGLAGHPYDTQSSSSFHVFLPTTPYPVFDIPHLTSWGATFNRQYTVIYST